MATFFQGTLQEGLAKAVRETKLVACFVTDEQVESRRWEDELLSDDHVASLLAQGAVALRLVAGSQEAAYLAAIYPLPKVPTLVLMQSNGQLKDYIAAGTSKEDFLNRVCRVFGQTYTSEASNTPSHVASDQGSGGMVSPALTSNEQQPQPAVPSTSELRRVEDEERLRATHEAERKQREEEEKRRKAKGKQRAEEPPKQETEAVGQARDQVKKASEQLKQRQLEAREERQRILRQIEHDKAERKAREEQRKEDLRAAAAAEDENNTNNATAGTVGTTTQASARRSEFCALQVRLLDGSSIRKRFPSNQKLGEHVREWIDTERPDDSREPYTFRAMVPHKAIDPTEEAQSLQDLGLAPSATLVLVPVVHFTEAYGDGNAGVLQRLIGAIVHFFTVIATFFTSLFPGAPVSAEEGMAAPAPADDDRNATVRRRGGARSLRDLNDERRDQQLYNGNSLNFESRKDEDDE